MNNENNFLPIDSIFLCLKNINDVNFTQREVDILSCILHGRTTKKIANLFSLSPKTVGAHVYNIMQKIDCNSREGIIDFVEIYPTNSILREYYHNLLIRVEFEKNLRNISKLKIEKTPTCIILYYKNQEIKNVFSQHIEAHLKLVDTTIKIYEQKLTSQTFNAKELKFTKLLITKKEYNDKILLDFKEISSVDIDEQENYYYCVFEILKKLYPHKDVINTADQFKIYCENAQRSFNNSHNYINTNYVKKSKLVPFYYAMLFLFILILFFSVHSFPYKKEPELKIEESKQTKKDQKKIASYTPIILAKHEAFIERKGIINQINKFFSNNNVVVIMGRPGVGKSCLAAEYARHQDRIVRYFDADSSEKIAQKYWELGQEFDIDVANQPNNLTIKIVNNYLSNASYNFLFVFDNVENYDDIKDYIFNVPQNVKVLITTTQPNLIINTGFATVDMKGFSLKEAKEYLMKCAYNRTLTEQDKTTIVEKFGTLPYDLKCVVAYLYENFTTPTHILIKDIEHKIDTKLFSQLGKNKNRSAAWKVLQYVAYLDPDFIDINLLNDLFLQNHNLTTSAIKTLESLSLISMRQDSDRMGVRVHRALQKEVKKTMYSHPKPALPEHQLISDLLQALDNLFPEVSDKPGPSWKEASILIPQVNKILEKAQEISLKKQEVETNLYYKLGRYYAYVYIDRPQALKFAKIALGRRNSSSFTHRLDLANSLESVGSIYALNNIKDIPKGIEYLKASLKIRKNLYLGEHPSIAATLRNIGLAYLTLEEKQKELHYMQASLKMRQSIYQGNHYEIAESLNDVAWAYYELGDFKNAKHYVQLSVDMFQILYPKGDPSMVYALHTLGTLMLREKNVKQGLEALHQALAITKTFHMDKHFTTAFICYDLGKAYMQNANYQKASGYTLAALKIRKILHEINGKRNLIDQSLHILGDIYKAEGKKEKAIMAYKQALKFQAKFSLTGHAESLEIQSKIKELSNEPKDNKIFSYFN